MPRHAAPNKQRARRSQSAQLAYRAGIVDRTIDLTRPPAISVRERAMATANRYSAALGLFAAMIWLYDVARVIRG